MYARGWFHHGAGVKVVLSDRDMEIIRRIQAGAFAHPEFDAQPDYVPYYTQDKETMPLDNRPVPKSRCDDARCVVLVECVLGRSFCFGVFVLLLFTSHFHAHPYALCTRFVPSKWEWIKVTKIVKGLKDGTILTRKEKEERQKQAEEERDQVRGSCCC